MACFAFTAVAPTLPAPAPPATMVCAFGAPCEGATPQTSSTSADCVLAAGPGPHIQTLSSAYVEDVWCFLGIAGATVHYAADTRAVGTAGDLWMCLSLTPSAVDVVCQISWADDNRACSYPPPSHSCPQRSFTLPLTGVWYVVVGAWNSYSRSGLLEYEVFVSLAGTPDGGFDGPADVHLGVNDQPETGS